MLVEEDIFEFQVAMYAGLVVNVCYSADELCKYALNFRRLESALFEQIVV